LHQPAFVASKSFEFGARAWALRVSSTATFDETIDTQKARLILFGGILVSALFAGIILSAGHNRLRAQQIAAVNRDLEQLAGELERAKTAAEAASQAKGDFMANVSHELRTPLTLILAPLEQLSAMAAAPADWRAHVERMTRNALILLNRVNDILDFSKADAGKFAIHWETVQLEVWLAPLLDDAAAVATSTGRSFSWEVDSSLDKVNVDSRHLEKIILNLISNALKFTPEGGWIKVAVTPFNAAFYELSVADSGRGIASDQLPELFSRFHQVDASATRQHGGSGIGLALVKQLVQLMGGEVGVQSDLDQGARFFVRMPYSPDAEVANALDSDGAVGRSKGIGTELQRARFAEAAGVNRNEIPTPVSESLASRARILVADDNPDMRALIVELLAEDYAVTTAADGLIAWTFLRQHPFDLVVSDVMMPGLDGLDLTARIKADALLARVPVILVTARGGAEASTAGLVCGANDYVAKPFSPSELRARVHAALRMAELQAQLREASRESGIAMLASGIMHNVGNLLCNVSVSAELVHNIAFRSDVASLAHVAETLRSAREASSGTIPPAIPEFVAQLAQRLQQERATVLSEAKGLRDGITHAAAIIAAQQQLAKPGPGLVELVSIRDLLDTVQTLTKNRIAQLGIVIARSDSPDAVALVDRYKVLQILLNLVANATDALEAVPIPQRRIVITSERGTRYVHVEITDSGSGIDAQDIPFLFNQGFTTKGDGHGYGLHLSSVWAHEFGGTLECCSHGPGGATFRLRLPSPHLTGLETADDAAAVAS
jgi:signal transduction histidine kinase